MASEFNGVIFFVNKSDVNFNFFWEWENIMNENKEEKVCVCFKIENGLQIHIDIPKFATAKNLVDICSEQFHIDKQKHRINLKRNNISLTSGDSGQVLTFADGDVINVSFKQKWIKVNFILASKQQISLEEVVEVLRK